MKKNLVLLLALALMGALIFLAIRDESPLDVENRTFEPEENADVTRDSDSATTTEINETEREPVVVVAENLAIPWDIAFLPDGTMLVTERPGRVVHIESGEVFTIEGVEHVGEGGLLGMALHPDFETNRFVYLYQTSALTDRLINRVVRYTYENNSFTFDRVILDALPGARYHDGGRIAFGPDGKLYVTLGDATSERLAQDVSSLAGSILRINDDGSIPNDNPFGSAVYSYGHRNPQGLAWDAAGRLWSTEHGRSGVQSGYDELNLITAGENYGWPESEGDAVAAGTLGPALHSGADDTWAPGGALHYEGRIFFGGLRGAALYEAVLRGGEVVELKEHFKNEYGRIRTVVLGPDGYLYMTTSNRDGRGSGPVKGDDRIIKVDPETL